MRLLKMREDTCFVQRPAPRFDPLECTMQREINVGCSYKRSVGLLEGPSWQTIQPMIGRSTFHNQLFVALSRRFLLEWTHKASQGKAKTTRASPRGAP